MNTGGINNLENAVLEWIIEHYNNPMLTAQIKSAKLKERQWTKVGFFVYLEVDKKLPPVDGNLFYGPDLQSEDIEYGACTQLYLVDGYLDNIEMAAYGEYFNEEVKEFKLSAYSTGR